MPLLKIGGNYLTADDVGAKGTTVVFVDAGEYVTKEFDGQKKERLEISVALPDESVKKWSPNFATLNEIAKAYGMNTDAWVGKAAHLWTAKQAVAGKMLMVIYGEPVVLAEEKVEEKK